MGEDGGVVVAVGSPVIYGWGSPLPYQIMPWGWEQAVLDGPCDDEELRTEQWGSEIFFFFLKIYVG